MRYVAIFNVWASISENHNMFEKNCRLKRLLTDQTSLKNLLLFFCCCCCCCYFGFRVIMFLPKTTTSRYENCAIFFAALCFYLHHLKKLSQIFKILFSTGDIYNFVIRCVISVLHLKFYTTDFSSQKILAKISETHFYRKAVLV